MSKILKHIDQIAREKQRDVYIIQFDKKVYPRFNYKEYSYRDELLEWLDNNNIGYEECFSFASDNGFESYRGQLYIDIEVDETKDVCKKLKDYIKPDDGDLRFEGIDLWTLSLSLAMKYAYRDEDDYEGSLL